MIKVIVTGANGQLGHTLRRELPKAGYENVTYIDVDDLDITDEEAVMRYFGEHPCSILINCAAYTAVDRAEEEYITAFEINGMGAMKLAQAAKEYGFKMIHISTDYVFSGDNLVPYKEDDLHVEAERLEGARTIYGRSKLMGEFAVALMIPLHHVVIRTSWLYSEYGHNFFKTMLRKAQEGESVRVVADQMGCPTYAGDLAHAIIGIMNSETWYPGTYHYSNSGVTSWYEFAASIYQLAGTDPCNVHPIATEDYPTEAERPRYSALDTSKIRETYHVDCPDWHQSLKSMELDYINKWN